MSWHILQFYTISLGYKLQSLSILGKPFFLVLLMLVIILLTLYFTQKGIAHKPDRVFLFRKILHIVSIGLCSFAIQYIGSTSYLTFLFFLASVLLAIEVRTKFLRISEGNSFGIALFPFAFALLMVAGVDAKIIALGGYVLTFSDALAGLIGRRFGQFKITPFKEEKTVLGSLTFFVITATVLSTFNWLNLPFYAIVTVSLIATLAEMFSWRGSDNFTIILFTVLSMLLFINL